MTVAQCRAARRRLILAYPAKGKAVEQIKANRLAAKLAKGKKK